MFVFEVTCTAFWDNGDILTLLLLLRAMSGSMVLVAWVCAGVPCCQESSHRSPRLGLQPEVLMVYGAHAATRTIMT